MKHHHLSILVLALLLIVNTPIATAASADTPSDDQTAIPSDILPVEAEYAYRVSEPVDVQSGCYRITADSGSLLHDLTLHAISLPLQSGFTMHSSMRNVTADGDGVRLLPNGIHFSEEHPVRITLAYDPQRIPAGYTAENIYTFYCEENGGQWYRLERIGIDTAQHTITSLTTHFTDFANAIISLPELPESNAFVPTTMTDIPDPDPLQGIPMVQVNGLNSFGSPTGDNSGNASLTYPIVIPAGRHGLQPDVNLYYNSANGNGPLGVGWSIPMPAVTIDTRWGVPRYDAVFETEAYLVNGEPVVRHDHHDEPMLLPHQDSEFRLRSQQTERFWFRDRRNASRVIRHGRFPSEYWWEVTTTAGVTYYYGREFDPDHPQHDGIDENSVLRDEKGNIGYWALTAVVDLDGNYILYKNRNSSMNGGSYVPNPTGDNIWMDSILYTGNRPTSTRPTYKIGLSWTGRNDDVLDGRLGVLRLTDKLLCGVCVLYKDTVISSYYIRYECNDNSLWKSRMIAVIKSDEPKSTCGCEDVGHDIMHDMEYRGSRTVFNYNNASPMVFGIQHQLPQSAKGLGNSASGGFNVGGTATVGIGFNPYMTDFSGGGNFDFSMNFGKMQSMLIDLNGDGLPDLVYQDGNVVKYRPRISSAYQAGFGNEIVVQGLTCLSHEVSQTYSWGLQLSFVGHLHYSHPTTYSYTDYYFSDVNADGLPDMVTPEGILFNHLNSNGHPTFTPYAGGTIVTQHNTGCPDAGIHYTGTVDERLECDVREIAVDSLPIGDIYDPGWIEPDYFKSDYWDEDGELSTNQWNPLPTDKSKSTPHQEMSTIAEYADSENRHEDHAEQTARERSSDQEQNSKSTPVIPEGFYEDGYIYRIERGRIIKYGIETVCHNENPDPVIETVRVWVAEESGYVEWVNSSIQLREDTSASRRHSRKADGVRGIIQVNRNNQTDGSHITATQAIMLHADTIAADDYTIKSYTSSGFTVNAGDMILFRLCSGDNSMFDDVDWNITIRYYASGATHQTNSSEDYICTGNRVFVAPLDGSAIIRYKVGNDSNSPITLSFYGSNKPAVTFSGQGSTNGVFVPFDTVQLLTGDTIKPIVGNANAIWSDVHIHPEIEFHWSHPNSNNTATIQDTTFFYPDVDYPCSVIDADSVYTFLFGKLHKGWGRFAYRPMNSSDTLDVCSLVNTERQAGLMAAQESSTLQTYALPQDSSIYAQHFMTIADSLITAKHLFNPLADSSTWIPIYPDSRTERWIPYGNLGYICKTGQSNSRNIYIADETNRVIPQLDNYGISMPDSITCYDSAIPSQSNSLNGRDKVVLKSTKSVQNSLSWGVLMMSDYLTHGSYDVTTDYIDLNGDGFPDCVGPSGVQYSLPWGGIGALQAVGIDNHSSSNTSVGVGLSASVGFIKKLMKNGVNNPGFTLDGSGASVGYNLGEDHTERSFVDMNGDGLPDIVSVSAHTVRYNLGYTFTAPMPLPAYAAFEISTGHSHTENLSGVVEGATLLELPDAVREAINAGMVSELFAIEQYSISGGVDLSACQNITDVQLRDVNGDGLPDLVRRDDNNAIYVAYNQGGSFTSYIDVSLQAAMLNSISVKVGATASATLGVAFGIFKITGGIGGGGNGNWTFAKSDFIDMNADGLLDYVVYENDKIIVRYNQNAGTNLLSSVTNPTGQQIHLDYILTNPSKQHRQRQWVLESIRDEDASNPWVERQQVLTMRGYGMSFYDNYERTDYGFAQVVTNEANIRQIDECYANNAYIMRGRKITDLLTSHEGIQYIGHSFTSSYSNGYGEVDYWNCHDAGIFPYSETVLTEYYEGGKFPQITTRIRMRYDSCHNLVEYFDDGDTIVTGDEWHRTIAYLPTTYMNLVSLPVIDSIMTSSGHPLRLRYASWQDNGRLRQMRAVDPQTNTSAMTSLFYDMYGNVEHYRMPKNRNGERVNSIIYYDDDLHTYPSCIKNQFDERTHIYYNSKWGLPISIIDPYGKEITYTYDYMGRLTHVLAPRENDACAHYNWCPDGSSVPYTVRYTYNNIHHNLFYYATDTLMHAYVLKQSACAYDHDQIMEAAIYSARGELLQKKRRTEVFGQVGNLTNGKLNVDALGRAIYSCYPSMSPTALWLYDEMSNSTGSQKIKRLYDILDRDTLTILSDESTIHKHYSFDTDCANRLRFTEKVKDQLDNVTTSFTAPQGWIVQTTFADDSSTCYEYDCIGELTRVTDADGYQTQYAYNGFGQLVERNHPDAGITRWRYDASGQLVCSRTQKQLTANDSTTYHYIFNRLMEERHALHPWENVTYNYDMAGRLALRVDRTGSERLWYDELGNVRQTLRRIVLPMEPCAFEFMTKYTYDSFGKIRILQYPDAEKVYYNYNLGGNLFNVLGNNTYVDSLWYNEFGQLARRDYGNRVSTRYFYDANRRWIKRILTQSGIDLLQDLRYNYDPVGNITGIGQLANSEPGMGSAYGNDYVYDNRYRLVYNIFSSSDLGMYQYDVSYSSSGKMGIRSSSNVPNVGSFSLKYGYDNQVQTHQPRVVYNYLDSEHRMQLYWDGNGNLEQIQITKNGSRYHMWDDNNRLSASLGPTTCGYYGNASDGSRAYKMTGLCASENINNGIVFVNCFYENDVLYPNPYVTITRMGYTKHYYMGSERIATSIGGGGFCDMTTPTRELTTTEYQSLSNWQNQLLRYPQTNIQQTYNLDIQKNEDSNLQYVEGRNMLWNFDMHIHPQGNYSLCYLLDNEYCDHMQSDNVYFCHSDHLGSASWITNKNGKPIQYVHYGPYGELIANQTPHGYDERYKFTGKERDYETGYDYFGARNLCPAIGHWLSVDPLASDYPWISPYAYCIWNPINNIDPNGCFSIENIDSGTNYETILVLPSESVLKAMGYNERLAFDETREQAHSVCMPTIYVDNAQDYADAMAELGNMNSSTNSYVLATSHGYKRSDISGIKIGTDMYTNMSGDLSALCLGLVDKTVFITACALTSSDAGMDLIRRFALQTGAAIIGSDYSIPAYLGGLRGGDLNMSPKLNALLGIFGGNYQNSFQLTDGTITNTIYNLTIDKNKGIRWNGGNKSIFSR